MKNLSLLPKLGCRTLLAGLALLPAGLLAQGTVTGIVEDATNGLRLEGVRITVAGTDLVATTDRAGTFFLRNVPSGAQSLRFNYLGTSPVTEAVTVTDGGSVSLAVAMNDSEVVELEDFVVTDRQTGTARALNAQRSLINRTTVVAADALGQFPDQNIAESLQRLPGITLQRDQGEGRFVVVRGINPDLNSTTINGVHVPGTESGSRTVNLDVVPNHGVAAVEVTKAITPDMDGDTIGGNVNIRTLSPFDEGGQVARFSAGVEYSEFVEEWGQNFNGVYGQLLNDDTLGYIFSGSYSVRDFGSDSLEVGGFERLDNGNIIPDEIELREYILERRRLGLTGALEYKPTENAFYYLRAVYNAFDDTEQRYTAILKPLTGLEDLDEPEDSFGNLSGNTAVAETEIDLKDRIQSSEIWNVVAGGVNYVDDFTIDYSLSYSVATEYEHERLNAAFEADEPSRIAYRFSDFYTPVITDQPDANTVSLNDASNYLFDEIGYEDNDAEEEFLIGEVNVRYDLELGERPAFLKAGLKYRANEKDADANETIWGGGDDDLSLAGFARFSSDFSHWDGPSLDQSAFREFYTAADQLGDGVKVPVELTGNGGWTVNPTGDTNFFEFEESDTVENAFTDDYVSNEDIFAAYAMGSVVVGEFTILGGVRVEQTDFETEGFEVVFNEDGEVEAVNPLEADNDYTDILPSLHIRYDVSPQMQFRFAATRSLARPMREDSAIRRSVNREDEEVFVGNPDLDPYEATNVDMSFDYYFDRLGVFSLGVFYKDISEFIFLDGTGTTLVNDEEFDFATPRNGDTAEITGIEVAYGVNLGLFHDALEPFRFDGNVTLTDSTADYGDGNDDLPFIAQADTVLNLGLAFENGPFFVRLAANYRDSYLDSFDTDEDAREYVDNLWRFDVKSSFAITDQWTAVLEVINLTDEPFRAYFGDRQIISRQREEYGVTVKFALNWQL